MKVTINILDDDYAILSSDCPNYQTIEEYLVDQIQVRITNQILARKRRDLVRQAQQDASRMTKADFVSSIATPVVKVVSNG